MKVNGRGFEVFQKKKEKEKTWRSIIPGLYPRGYPNHYSPEAFGCRGSSKLFGSLDPQAI